MPHHLRLTPVPLAAFALLIVLAGCGGTATPNVPGAVSTTPPSASSLPAAPPATAAPEVTPNTVSALGITDPTKWYNTAPLTLEALRGKPVFLVFWSDI